MLCTGVSVAVACYRSEESYKALEEAPDGEAAPETEATTTLREHFILKQAAGTNLSVSALFGDPADTAHAQRAASP